MDIIEIRRDLFFYYNLLRFYIELFYLLIGCSMLAAREASYSASLQYHITFNTLYYSFSVDFFGFTFLCFRLCSSEATAIASAT